MGNQSGRMFDMRPGKPTPEEALRELMIEVVRVAKEAADEADRIQLGDAIAFARDARRFARRWE